MRLYAALIVAGCAAAAPACAQTANAFADFALKKNPNGAWSYLAGGALLAQTLNPCAGVTKLLCRWNGGGQPNSAIVGANKNHGNADYYTIVLPPKYLVLDPEQLSDATVQWTAPAAATVLVTGNFLGVDTSEASHAVAVLHNGVSLKSFTISQYQQKAKFKLKLAVAAGDTISFSSTTSGYAYLSTGLQATITPQ